MDVEKEDSSPDSDSSMMSTIGNFDRNEVPGCSQFPMHPSCPINHQQGCMLWSPEPCNLNKEQPGISPVTPLPRNEDQMMSSDEGDGECESNWSSSEDIDQLMEEAENAPNAEELTALRLTLDVQEQQRTPTRLDEDPDDYIFTSDSTFLRLKRYVDQRSSHSNDPDWGDDHSENYFTGSEETSGGEKEDHDMAEDGSDVE